MDLKANLGIEPLICVDHLLSGLQALTHFLGIFAYEVRMCEVRAKQAKLQMGLQLHHHTCVIVQALNTKLSHLYSMIQAKYRYDQTGT
jgi:hypothetical protein